MCRTSGSATGNPILSVALGLPKAISWLIPGVHQLAPVAVKEVMPSGGPVNQSRLIDPLVGV
jgi:hypothetical protein